MKTTKLPKFGLLYTFLKAKQNKYYETLKMTKLPKFGQIILFFESQTEQLLLRDFEDDEINKIWTYIHIFESQTEQQLLKDFDDDEITEIRTVHTFLKAKQKRPFRLVSFISHLYT